MYFFVRLYEYDEEQWDNRNLIDEDVFEAENRDEAKKHCIEVYGNYNFRLVKEK